jgi:ABC-type uncharacterized transport system substrate-binding protein
LNAVPIPIVFVSADDPVAAGLVASLAHPGGDLTGVSTLTVELLPKLLSELVPHARIALLVNPNNPQTEGVIKDAHEAARTKGVQLPNPKGRHRKRDRRRLRNPRPTASRRVAGRPRPVLSRQPAPL